MLILSKSHKVHYVCFSGNDVAADCLSLHIKYNQTKFSDFGTARLRVFKMSRILATPMSRF